MKIEIIICYKFEICFHKICNFCQNKISIAPDFREKENERRSAVKPSGK